MKFKYKTRLYDKCGYQFTKSFLPIVIPERCSVCDDLIFLEKVYRNTDDYSMIEMICKICWEKYYV